MKGSASLSSNGWLVCSVALLAHLASTAVAFCPLSSSIPFYQQVVGSTTGRFALYSKSAGDTPEESYLEELWSNNKVDNLATKLPSSSGLVSARVARIGTPLAIAAASFLANPLVAKAGIGTVVPVEVTLKEKFRGAISNSVVLLRLNSTLRKLGYYQNKARVASFDSPTSASSELASDLSRQFSDGKAVYALPGTLSAYVEATQGKRAMIVYGPEVSISIEGEVGSQQGPADVAATEQKIVDQVVKKLLASGISEVCLLGGTLIHRPKTGGKAAGEDYFLPRAITSWKLTSDGSLVTMDVFDKVFGDLPTPRQTK
jgi:hypothetical protein